MSLGEIIGALVPGIALLGAITWKCFTVWTRAKKVPGLVDAVNLFSLELVQIKTKVGDIWDIFLEEGRTRRSDMRDSPRLSEKGKEMVPNDIKEAICHYRKDCHNDCEIAGHEIVSMIIKSLGIGRLSSDAKERGVSLQEYVAMLADYYED